MTTDETTKIVGIKVLDHSSTDCKFQTTLDYF
jgi:hypothetical protein